MIHIDPLYQQFKRCWLQPHQYQHVRNIYGDEILEYGWMRSVWRCTRCGHLNYKHNTHDPNH